MDSTDAQRFLLLAFMLASASLPVTAFQAPRQQLAFKLARPAGRQRTSPGVPVVDA